MLVLAVASGATHDDMILVLEDHFKNLWECLWDVLEQSEHSESPRVSGICYFPKILEEEYSNLSDQYIACYSIDERK